MGRADHIQWKGRAFKKHYIRPAATLLWIPPSAILDTLRLLKCKFLTREQLEAGDWITDAPGWYLTQARIGLPDSESAKIRRNKKLREKAARALEGARRVLLDYPEYLLAVGDMPDPYLLPDRLTSIAKHIRDNGIKAGHRPRAAGASQVISALTILFKEVTGNPLYEHAGRLTKLCFPEEWNPAGDIREAAKKLIKRKC